MRIVAATLTAREPERLQAWYTETLGVEQPRFVAGETSAHHLAFHVGALDGWPLELSEEHDFSAWDGARARYFRDPEGNVGELIARPRARPELTLAEVGLPVLDVPAAVEALGALGLTPHQRPTETFAPLGDGDGLLIVVSRGRSWFPTEEPSGAAPVEVTVTGAGTGELRLEGHRIRVAAAAPRRSV